MDNLQHAVIDTLKKLLILLILLIASPVMAQQCSEPVEVARMSPYFISGSVPVAVACPCWTGETFGYNGNHSSGVNFACDSAGGAIEGTVSGATVTSDYILIESTNQYVSYPIDASEMNMTAANTSYTIYFTIEFIDGNANSDVDSIDIMECQPADTADRLYIYTDDASDDLVFSYTGGGVAAKTVSTATTLTLTPDKWRCGVSWRIDAGYDMAASCVLGEGTSPSWTEQDRDITAFNGDSQPTNITWGENTGLGYGVPDDYKISNISIWAGYKAVDPMD